MTDVQAIKLLDEAARELAEIHRGKHYAFWRDDRRRSLGDALRRVSPFDAYSERWIFTGDGGGAVAHGRFGDWAIDRLVGKSKPAAILLAFREEIATNVGHYSELSAVEFHSAEQRMFSKDTAVFCSRKRSKVINRPRRGQQLGERHKARIADGLTGKTKSEEHRQNISEANKGVKIAGWSEAREAPRSAQIVANKANQ